MKNSFNFLFTGMLFLLFASTVFGQFDDPRKWNTQISPTGEIFTIPPSHLNYIHPNKTPKVIRTILGEVTVEPNIRVYPSNFTQSEVPITRHPVDPDILFASSNSVRISPFFISEGVYVTTDGGLTWFGSDTTNASPISLHGGDPAPGIDANGRFYQSYLDGSFNGLRASYSTDLGENWAASSLIISGSQDKNHTIVDNVPTSPYFGRVYVSWSRFTAFNPPIAISYSSDGGVSWTSSQDINSVSAGHYSQGVNGAIGPNGEVYMAYQNPISSSPFTGDFMGLAKSTDGGDTWTFNNNIYECNGIRGFLTNKASIRVNDFPWMGVDTTNGPMNGWIYIVHAEKNLAPAGSDPDIILHRSTDGGDTWSAGIRVNQDALNNGADQYMPALVVGQDGSVNVVYYDSRATSPDSAEIYISRSLDGGDTWTDVLVSDHRFKPKPIAGLAGGYQGDYIGITEAKGVLWPYWADDVTGIYQAWTAAVTFGPPCPVEPAFDPIPVTGAGDVSINLTELSWSNGAGAVTNDLYFGTNPGALSLVQSGTLANSWTINTSPLDYSTTYYWRVVEIGDTCSSSGPIWNFSTESDPNVVLLWEDDFESGAGNWSITNDGGNCVWEVVPISNNSYTLPGTASGDVFAADADDCGSGTTLLSTATLVNPIDASGFNIIWFEFDNDWQAIDNQDFCYVEVSTDSINWNAVLVFDDVDVRNSHEVIDVSSAVGDSLFWLRLRTIQPGWDWWWVVDNFQVFGTDPVPVELTSFSALVNEAAVELNWSTATELNNQGFQIERKADGNFEKVGFVPGFGTTTQSREYSFVDSKVSAGTYTYRLKQIDFDGSHEYSSEIEVEIEVPSVFALEQNYPNPFNPATVIKYSIPKDGFVNISVYNILGEVVSLLVSENQKAGSYEVNFNASNFSSGVYFYKLESGDFTSIKKMLLLK